MSDNNNTYRNNVTQSPFVLGVGGFVGLQAFIADLPVAVGFEYGLAGLLRAGSQYKYTVTDNNGKDQIHYSTVKDDSNPAFKSLSISKWELGGDFRVTISYFF
jgi:subtilase family serine protease